MDQSNPQMKMMLWILPIFMVGMFAFLPAGLNLYYFTANLATLPQSWWIAKERQKVQAKGPPKPLSA
jgi:YidC/Oxa1 family membrane protein insertase